VHQISIFGHGKKELMGDLQRKGKEEEKGWAGNGSQARWDANHINCNNDILYERVTSIGQEEKKRKLQARRKRRREARWH